MPWCSFPPVVLHLSLTECRRRLRWRKEYRFDTLMNLAFIIRCRFHDPRLNHQMYTMQRASTGYPRAVSYLYTLQAQAVTPAEKPGWVGENETGFSTRPLLSFPLCDCRWRSTTHYPPFSPSLPVLRLLPFRNFFFLFVSHISSVFQNIRGSPLITQLGNSTPKKKLGKNMLRTCTSCDTRPPPGGILRLAGAKIKNRLQTTRRKNKRC